jgi:membrane-bound serine protease (ClpP class)
MGASSSGDENPMKARGAVISGIIFIMASILSFNGLARAAEPNGRDVPLCTLEMRLTDTIGPAALDFVNRGFERARDRHCSSILMLINTPGGSLQTTRLIVEKILASEIPVLCLVSPEGGHAGSAGAIILQACHVAGAEMATNLGAATPVTFGASMPEDIKAKIMQDTVSWVRGLARLRGRNLEFAEKIVTEARAVDASDAAKIGAIDVVVEDVKHFLNFSEGRLVTMRGGEKQSVRTGVLIAMDSDMRNEVLRLITDPEFAYLLFMISLGLLYFEITHPGVYAPGVAGGLGLIISLIAFHKLEVWWGAVLLIVSGLGLMIAEAFVPSFGALGIGGVIALAVGSVLLFDPNSVGGGLPLSLIVTTVGALGGITFLLAFVAFRTRRRNRGKASLETVLIGRSATVVSLEAPSRRRGMVSVEGEFWRFVSEQDVQVGDVVTVVEQEQLHVKVVGK